MTRPMLHDTLEPCADMAENARLEHAFATPIFSYSLPNADRLNFNLLELILAREGAMPSRSKSNQGGWQSSDDVFCWDHAAIRALSGYLKCALDLASARVAVPPNLRTEYQLSGWAAVNRRGHYNTPHLHPMATWSGIYYVDPGDGTAGIPNAVLEFAHPIAASAMTFFPGILPSARTVQPEAGMIILFPSYLQHSVRVYDGDRPRVCVAFNAHALRVVPR